jgi:hypothetical protein
MVKKQAKIGLNNEMTCVFDIKNIISYVLHPINNRRNQLISHFGQNTIPNNLSMYSSWLVYFDQTYLMANRDGRPAVFLKKKDLLATAIF